MYISFLMPPVTAHLVSPLPTDAKKGESGHRIREVEHGVFTPLVCTSTGGMGWETKYIKDF